MTWRMYEDGPDRKQATPTQKKLQLIFATKVLYVELYKGFIE